MSATELKEKIHAIIDRSSDEEWLQDILALLQSEEVDWYDELTEDERKGIEESMAAARRGEVYSTEEVLGGLGIELD